MSGRRRGKGGHEEHHVDERWLVSYADMITVLMALFIVLYAMSTVDQHKFDVLKNSLATGFGVTKSVKDKEDQGPVKKKDKVKNGAGFSNSTIALMQVAKEIQDELKVAGMSGKAKVSTGTNSITVSLVGSSTYFDGNSADLRPEAKRVLKAMVPTLKKHAGTVTVEGHADPRGRAGSFGNDYQLAGSRASAVLWWLLERHALDPAISTSVSHGSTGASQADTSEAIEHNRRVDIVLHSVITSSVADAAAAKADTAETKAKGGTDPTPAASASAKAEAAGQH